MSDNPLKTYVSDLVFEGTRVLSDEQAAAHIARVKAYYQRKGWVWPADKRKP